VSTRFHLRFPSVPASSDRAPFFGNGRLGSLLTVVERELRFTVDHPGLWELRDCTNGVLTAPYAEWAHLDMKAREQLLAPTFPADQGPVRTKLPALQLVATLPAVPTHWTGEIDLCAARGLFSVDESGFSVWVASHAPLLVIEGSEISDWDWAPRGWDLGLPGLAQLRGWGYVEAEPIRSAIPGLTQVAQRFGEDCVAMLGVLRRPGFVMATMDIVSVASTRAQAERQQRFLEQEAAAIAKHRVRHAEEWRAYWDRAELIVPEPELQAALDVERYKLFCNARADGPPVTLQGVFNRADILPPWCGDLHHNLNVQACYWAAWKLNSADLARGYVETLGAQRERFEERARRLFGIEGALHLPLSTAPSGETVPTEFNFWTTLTGMELFAACDLVWHAEHSGDGGFRQQTALPWLRATIRLWRSLGEKGADGRLHFPRTHSPEVFEDGEMVLATDATFVVSSLAHLSDRLIDWETEPALAAEWRSFRAALPTLPVDASGLRLFADRDLRRSHRHFCHLFPIFPLCTLDRAEPEDDALIQASLDTLTRLGPMEFAAWSFPYLAILAARGGRGEMAALQLEIYRRAFRSANTFTVNGDVFRSGAIAASDLSAGAPCDAFTLDAGLLVPAAVAEMLVHRAGDTLWILPALPREWRECAAENLTVPGAHRISLVCTDGRLTRLTVTGGCHETLRIRVGVPGRWPDELALRPGETLTLLT